MPLLILVADDDAGVRISISDFLETSGYNVVLAENGQEALALVDQCQPHLLVTDITMPLMDGYDLVRRVRQYPAFRLLPVVFLTERTQTQERIQGYQVGCDVYLPKPFDLQELGAVIRNLLERSQLIQTAWQYTYKDMLLSQSAPSIPQPIIKTANLQQSVSKTSEAPQLTQVNPNPISANVTMSLPFVLHLSEREQEVLQLLTDGLSNAQIGDSLHLSPRTVEKYVSSLLRKTLTSNRADLVHFAMKYQLVH
jgi:DNA-binding NarL/FixJ family response regulator